MAREMRGLRRIIHNGSVRQPPRLVLDVLIARDTRSRFEAAAVFGQNNNTTTNKFIKEMSKAELGVPGLGSFGVVFDKLN